MSPEWMNILTWVIFAVIVGALLWQSRTTLTVAKVIAAVKDAKPIAADANLVAERAVMAAEQYAAGGVLVTSDEKLRFAIRFFKRWLPAGVVVDDDRIVELIESFVPLANAVTAQINASRAAAPTLPPAFPASTPMADIAFPATTFYAPGPPP